MKKLLFLFLLMIPFYSFAPQDCYGIWNSNYTSLTAEYNHYMGQINNWWLNPKFARLEVDAWYDQQLNIIGDAFIDCVNSQ